MEDVLDVHHRPHDPRFPVIAVEDKPVQLVADVREPLPAWPDVSQRQHHNHERHGTTNIFNAVEPPARWRRLAVTARRTRPDFAGFERDLVDDPRYAEADKIVLVMDPLHTHNPASFDNAIADEEARRLLKMNRSTYTFGCRPIMNLMLTGCSLAWAWLAAG
jgi:hypothetical protein